MASRASQTGREILSRSPGSLRGPVSSMFRLFLLSPMLGSPGDAVIFGGHSRSFLRLLEQSEFDIRPIIVRNRALLHPFGCLVGAKKQGIFFKNMLKRFFGGFEAVSQFWITV